jgi:hypothetical protein
MEKESPNISVGKFGEAFPLLEKYIYTVKSASKKKTRFVMSV